MAISALASTAPIGPSTSVGDVVNRDSTRPAKCTSPAKASVRSRATGVGDGEALGGGRDDGPAAGEDEPAVGSPEDV